MSNDKLRGVVEGLGFEGVSSVLASGNIVFRSGEGDSAALEAQIEDALTRRLGLASRTIVREASTLRALVDSDPFPGLTHGPGSYLTVTFLKDAARTPEQVPDRPDALTSIVRYDPAARAVLAVTDNSVPGRTPDFMAWLERIHGKNITTRSWLTVRRILTKLEG